MPDKQDNEKQFALKHIEQQILQSFEQTYFQNLSNFLSFISSERLAYPVTQNTKFRVEHEQLFISEATPEEMAAREGNTPTAAANEVSTLDDTGKAIQQ